MACLSFFMERFSINQGPLFYFFMNWLSAWLLQHSWEIFERLKKRMLSWSVKYLNDRSLIVQAWFVSFADVAHLMIPVPNKSEWVCGVCGFRNSSMFRTKRHIISKHTAHRLACFYCEKTFSRSDKRKDHYLKCHNLDLSSQQIKEMFHSNEWTYLICRSTTQN